MKVIVKPHTSPFYNGKIRKPGQLLELLPIDALKHDPSNKGKELKDKAGKTITRIFKGKKETLQGCGLASWMLPYSEEELARVQEIVDPKEKDDPVVID